MHFIDLIIFAIYFFAVLGVGIYFYLKNESRDDYYVGGRNISAGHVGLSIVATDVGGGFSIGLGGLGFTMGLAGSWLLFSGLVGAWLAAVLIIPRLKALDAKHGLLTYPDFLRGVYGRRVAMVAALISGIGYLGFTAAQILAGAKLAAGSVFSEFTAVDPLQLSLFVMAGVIVLYTVLGGIKAVIYTDTIQWIILLGGLIFLGLPFAWHSAGGWAVISEQLPSGHFSLLNIAPVTFVNWFCTIVPIWFIAMTLYQRAYACRNVKEARRAFYIAGVFEYPLMAFVGVSLGMLGRLFYPEADPEMALPLLLKEVLPIGVSGFVLAAYFSAVMSTADSCLIASSGNFVNDIVEPLLGQSPADKTLIRISQLFTLVIGVVALALASFFSEVLDIILNAYAFMVSGLFVPTLAAYFVKGSRPEAAMAGMLGGGGITLWLIANRWEGLGGLDPSIVGIAVSLAVFSIVQIIGNRRNPND
ncbi:MAG TPA: sodium:solute symporter family protein [Calditrichia bacterium]|nr:sodium:solute symporter family protein [Calditrichota bacterium]HQV30410.1 sodium:solute symporter family protein [Calditrichia bacterium]